MRGRTPKLGQDDFCLDVLPTGPGRAGGGGGGKFAPTSFQDF